MREERLLRFAELVSRPDDKFELDVIALSLGDWESGVGLANDQEKIVACQARLDEMAADAKVLAGIDGDQWSQAQAVAKVLFEQQGFGGDAAAYEDPRSSFLAEVLTSRVGLPITLSVLFMEVARRINVPAFGVALPSHFVVRVDAPGGDLTPTESIIVDPFRRGHLMSASEVLAVVRASGGTATEFTARLTQAASPRSIVSRMLRNLAGLYGRRGDTWGSLEVLERMSLLEPDNARLALEVDSLRARAATLN